MLPPQTLEYVSVSPSSFTLYNFLLLNLKLNFQFGGIDQLGEEMSAELMKKHMSDAEWDKVYEMSRDRNLYNNLINSLFPSIHGNDQIKKGIPIS